MSSSVDSLNGSTGAPINYANYTLDGRSRRKQRHATPTDSRSTEIPIETERWNDWTSTWRKMGNSGHSRDVTLTGTITRGKKKGQTVDVQLDLTNRELMEITQSNDNLESRHSNTTFSDLNDKTEQCACGVKSGPHVVLLGLVCFPFVFIASLFTSFYFGLLTWQNVFNYFYEASIWQRILICPPLVILFPVLILLCSLGIAVYAAFAQFWWSFDNWKSEVSSFEKGFYSWFCDKLNLEECCPYQVVELNRPEEVDSSRERILSDPTRNSGSRNEQFDQNQVVPLNDIRNNLSTN